MNQLNQDGSASSPADLPMKRKRGRPRKDESITQQEKMPITPNPDSVTDNAAAENLMGQVVSGVVEGSFDAGYFLSVKVGDTDKQLKGVAFIPGKVTPITAENDVAPHVKMYERREISFPSLNKQTQPQGQTDVDKQADTGSELQAGSLSTDKNQSAPCMTSFPGDHPIEDMGCGSELQNSPIATTKNLSALDETFLTGGSQIKDIDAAVLGEKFPSQQQISDSEPKSQALPLMPQSGNNDFPSQHNTAQGFEASTANNRANTDSKEPKDPVAEATPFVDFFPAPEMAQQLAPGCSSKPNLEFFQNETKVSETEQRKPPHYTEPRGFNLMTENHASPAESVPAELQLELGNKTTSGTNTSHPNGGFQNDIVSNITETNPQPASSMSGFLANLFEGESTATEPEPTAAESGFPIAPQAGNSSASAASNKNVDCNVEEAVPPAQPQNPLMLN